jgi:hypothetical protein
MNTLYYCEDCGEKRPEGKAIRKYCEKHLKEHTKEKELVCNECLATNTLRPWSTHEIWAENCRYKPKELMNEKEPWGKYVSDAIDFEPTDKVVSLSNLEKILDAERAEIRNSFDEWFKNSTEDVEDWADRELTIK